MNIYQWNVQEAQPMRNRRRTLMHLPKSRTPGLLLTLPKCSCLCKDGLVLWMVWKTYIDLLCVLLHAFVAVMSSFSDALTSHSFAFQVSVLSQFLILCLF